MTENTVCSSITESPLRTVKDQSFKVIIKRKKEWSAEERAFKKHATKHGLRPSSLGKTYKYSGLEWTLIGINPRVKSFPIIVKNGDVFIRPSMEYIRAITNT